MVAADQSCDEVELDAALPSRSVASSWVAQGTDAAPTHGERRLSIG